MIKNTQGRNLKLLVPELNDLMVSIRSRGVHDMALMPMRRDNSSA
jgi:hypothetical protein